MEKAIELLAELREQQIKLILKGDDLEVISYKSQLQNDQIQKIKSTKAEIISYLKSIERNEALYKSAIPEIKLSSEDYPVSNAQLRIWLTSQLEDAAVAYNIPNAIILNGIDDIDCFQKAIHAVIDRHEILRTLFKMNASGEVRQYIVPAQDLNFEIDIQDYRNADDPETVGKAYIAQDAYQPFDLVNGPLLRAALLRLSDDRYRFYYNMHHIVSDEWSMNVLSRDVMAFYDAYRSGVTPDLSPLRIQYKDYAAWQLNQLDSELYQFHKSYWLKRLSGNLPLIDLPSNKRRPPVRTIHGKSLGTFFSKDLTTLLNQFIRKEGGSLFMLILSAINVLIYKYTSGKDIIVESPFAGRVHANLKNQIGFYVNALIFRNQINPSESFTAFYKRVEKDTLEAFEHQAYPFDKLVEDLGLKYDQSRTAVYDISLTLHDRNAAVSSEDILPHLFEEVAVNNNFAVSKNDMAFHLTPLKDAISFNVVYNTDVYEEEMVSTMMQHMKQLFSSLLSSPESPIGYINYLSSAEHQELTHDFNNTRQEYPTHTTVLNLFEEQAVKNPQSKAIVFKDQELTYEALNQISNQLANCLVEEYGVKAGDLVGIQLDRSEWFVISILGILKTGAAYVPVDPQYPADRKQHMITDAGIELLLTDTTYMFDMDYYDGTLLTLDAEFDPSKYKSASLNITSPGDLAYVIYTSGSTGIPKGVMVDHSNLMNLVYWQKDFLKRKDPCQVMQYFSFSFDGAVGETFWTLCTGSTLCMYDHHEFNATGFYDYLKAKSINVFVTIPSFLKLLNPADFKDFPDLLIVVVGEIFDVDLYHKWKDTGVLVNGYGPTENTVYSTVYELGKNSDLSRIPIGKPISNTKVHILDDQLQLVPKGVQGEIYVSGKNVARGYLNREELTNERFIADVFEVKYLNHLSHSEASIAAFISEGNKKTGSRETFTLSIDSFYKDEELTAGLREALKSMYETGSEVFRQCFLRYLNESKSGYYSSFGFTKKIISEILGEEEWSGMSVLDLGFGNGELLDMLEETGAEVHGVEANPYFVQKQLSRGHAVRMSRIDIEESLFFNNTGYEENQFDVVFMTLLLDRLEYPKQALEVLFRVLKTEGRFCVQTLLPIIPFDDGEYEEKLTYTAFAHTITKGQSEEEDKLQMLTLLQRLGGNEIEVRSLDYYVRSTDGNQKYTLWSFSGKKKEGAGYLYKTGDLGRWLSGGEIEFLGRKDDMVKIRGHRIELGEIESVLNQLEEITQSVVVVREDDQGSKDLVAYVVSEGEAGHTAIQKKLGRKLPDYMVPKLYISLEEMPLTTNGKIDRKALPALNNEAYNKQEYVAPESETEKRLVEMWQEVLGVEKVGTQDDFFALGGHSLSAIRLIGLYTKFFGKQVTIKDVFSNPVLKDHIGLLDLSAEKNYQKIIKVEESESYPLSNAQLRLWFTSQLEESSVAYNIPGSVVLDGTYDVVSFQKAIHAVIDRHEVLRTVFKMDDSGEIRQYILPLEELNFEIEIQDFRNVENPEAAYESYKSRNAYLPFDLATGPLFRAGLLQMSDDQYVFYYNMHHIISDAWSMDVLSRDVMSFYEAYLSGSNPDLPSLDIQYKDYAAWQLGQLNNEVFHHHKTYWLDRFRDEVPPLNLPGKKRRASVKTYNGSAIGTHLSPAITSELRNFSRAKEGSLFIGLLAAWKVLLYRYTGQTDIILGNPVADRDHPDLANQIGFYLNTLGLKSKVSGDYCFTDFYEQVKTNVLEAFEHKAYPFDKLIEELGIHNDISRNPLFDLLIDYHGISEFGLNFDQDDDLKNFGNNKVKFDLEIHLTEVNEGVDIVINFNRDLYEQEMVEKLMVHFKNLLKVLLENPEQDISSVNYLSEAERNQLLEEFNATQVHYSKDKTVLDLFADQVQKTPGALALEFGEATYTYKALEERSNQLATCLVEEYGIKKGDFVGIHLDRNESYLVSILGILKAGAAYVPIDVSYPANRKQYIIEDAAIQLLILDAHHLFDLDFYEGVMFALDVEFDPSKYDSKKTPAILPKDLAYVIYTSGSTGKPKGVMITHHSLANYIRWCTDYYLNENLRNQNFGMFTSPSFDLTITSIFLPLLNGAKLKIFKEREDLLDLFKEYLSANISGIKLTPSHVSLLKDIGIKNSNLELAIVGGEELKKSHIEILQQINPAIKIYNEYGPTETTVGCLTYEIQNVDTPIYIGKPVYNTSVYLLDQFSQLVPVGVIGEICIGGEGLSKGYINQPELTEEKFIDHPFKQGERLYRTGDLGCWLPDGNIEFKGRRDDQIKIRGYRVELGEIESVLNEVEGIQQSAVLASLNNTTINQLVAYVVCNDDLLHSEIQKKLNEKLPEYMVPKRYVTLEEMPLTSNGKIDRKALPTPDSEAYNQQEYVAPENETEKQLVEIWQEALELEKVGVMDDFFNLGGHSLSAIRLIGQYNKVFKKQVSIKDIFANPVLKDHVGLLDLSPEEAYEEILKIEESESYPLSNAQLRLWLASQLEESTVAYNMPGFIVLDGTYDVTSFQKAIYAVIGRHEILRTVFKVNDFGEVRQYILPAEDLNFKIDIQDYRNTADPNAAYKSYLSQDAFQPFDLAEGPLIRAGLLQVSDDQYVFYYNMHHIISDGWSRDVLSRDVMNYYKAFLSGDRSLIPPLRIQYKDYTAWQLEQLKNDEYEIHKQYWVDQFQGEIPVIDLPAYKRRPPVMTYNGKTIGAHLSEEVTSKLRGFTNKKGGSLYTGLLAAWKVLLYYYTGQTDIIVGNPIANRGHADLENQIGFYANTLPLRNRINPTFSFTELYEQIKENTLEAYKHQMYPFDKLLMDLGLNNNPERSLLIDVLVDYHGVSESGLEFKDGEELSIGKNGVIKADIELHLTAVRDGVDILINYNRDIYEQEMVEGLIIHFKRIVKGLLDQPEESVSKVEYLLEKEKNIQLDHFNNTQVDFTGGKTVVDLFEQQVLKTPENIALLFKEKQFTYKELNDRANQLADYLKSNYEIQPNDLVGIKLDRSEWVVVAILAVLKSSAAYIPIDPEYPEGRISFLLEDSNCKLLIDDEELDKFKKARNKNGIQNLPSPVSPDSLAYVIYTSGSTGKPKGVMVTHGNLFNHIAHLKNERTPATPINMPFIASYAFDISLYELFYPLTTGGKSILLEKEVILDTPLLLKELSAAGATAIDAVPALFEQICNTVINQKANVDLSEIKHIFVGGDKVPDHLLSSLQKVFTAAQITIQYGPTEASIFCTKRLITTTESDTKEKGTHIGKPIANTDIYILNEEEKLLPIGVTGEICIGGRGVSKGYLNRPELTKEKFIANPFKAGERIYKTGDLGRWLSDGSLEFIGRKDDQVKIRGYRIELGEIENLVKDIENINQVQVIVQKESKESARLIGYFSKQAKTRLHPSLAEYFVYDDLAYHHLTTDEKRNNYYKRTFKKHLKDKIVLEIGSGPEAILSQFAIEAGAEKVYSVEIQKDIYDLAKEKIRELGLDEKIILINGDISQVSLPEQVDYCISEIVGSIGGSEGAAKLINISRKLLKHPENMIPRRSLTKIAAVHFPEHLHQYSFDEFAKHYVDKIFEQVGYPFDLRLCIENFPLENILSNAAAFEDLDYTRNVLLEEEHSVTFEINKPSFINGFIVWLNLYVDEDEVIDTLSDKYVWLPIYLPVFNEEIWVEKGDRIKATIVRQLSDNGLNPDFIISGELIRDAATNIPFSYKTSNHEEKYRSNSFYDKLFSEDHVIEKTSDINPGYILSHLESQLPDYMIPKLWVELEEFPLTPNGKIDRKALPVPGAEAYSKKDYIAPASETEKKLAAIWEDVLGLEKIGVQDEFFYLGGNSLNAVKIISRIRKELEIKIEIKDVYNLKTIRDLAFHIDFSSEQETIKSNNQELKKIEL